MCGVAFFEITQKTMAKHNKHQDLKIVPVPQTKKHNQIVPQPCKVEATNKNKKQNQKRKKLKTSHAAGSKLPQFRGVEGFTDSYIVVGQMVPPSIPIEKLFPDGQFPIGEIQDYSRDFISSRTTSDEKRALDREQENLYQELRQAAGVHRHVRKFAQGLIKPGLKLIDLCTQLENMNRKLVVEAGLDRGIAFPTGCSLNHVAAHYTPNSGDETVLTYGDVMKLDFGTHVNGRIIDSAWTVAFDPQFDPLLEAAKSSTNAGIACAGIDARLGEIGGEIQEVMESYEVTIDGKTYPVQAIRNLNGHSIDVYQTHGSKTVPIVKTADQTKMEEGEIFAIETFGTTGRGYVVEDGECSHYSKTVDVPQVMLSRPRAKKLLEHITCTFGTLPWCRRWIEREDGGSAMVNPKGAKQEKYLRISWIRASSRHIPHLWTFGAATRHTFILRPTCKEVLSRGDDY